MNNYVEDLLKSEDEIRPSLEAEVTSALSNYIQLFLDSDMTIPQVDSFSNVIFDIVKQGIELGVRLQAKSLADRYFTRYGASRARLIQSTTNKQLLALIARGQRQGLNRDEILDLIASKLPNMARGRAMTIVNTELHAATQFGSLAAARDKRGVLTKTWYTVEDDKVRSIAGGAAFSHTALHMRKIDLNSSFLVPRRGGGFEEIKFPGDPDGSPGNIINCRCTQIFE